MNSSNIKLAELAALADVSYHEDLRPQVLKDMSFDPNPYYRFLYAIAYRYKPKVAVELGTSYGGGTQHLAYGNPEGVVYSIDNHQIAKNLPANVHLIEGDTRNRDYALFPDKSVGLLFIDSTHEANHAWQEYATWYFALIVGAIILADDIYMAGMREFWDRITLPKFQHDGLHDTCGFGVAVNL